MADPRLRPVDAGDAGDDALLLTIYAGTRAEELALTGWDTATREAFVRQQFEAQRTHYRLHWPAARHDVIEVELDGRCHAVGRLWVDRREASLHVLDIALLPHWRGRGIGSTCLRRLMDEAAAGGGALSIHVEAGNPAHRLYERLGFEPVGAAQGVHQRMVWQARAPEPVAR